MYVYILHNIYIYIYNVYIYIYIYIARPGGDGERVSLPFPVHSSRCLLALL